MSNDESWPNLDHVTHLFVVHENKFQSNHKTELTHHEDLNKEVSSVLC